MSFYPAVRTVKATGLQAGMKQVNAVDAARWVAGLKDEYIAGAAGIRDSHFSGASGISVVRANSALMDRVVSKAFGRVCDDLGLPAVNPGWALTAVGGYGRGELNPHSDVDIMFIERQADGGEVHRGFPTSVLHILWDLGLDIGYSVRCLADCKGLMKSDSTIMTSMLESRLICGDKAAFEGLAGIMDGIKSPRAVEAYIREKLNERTRRHKKHGDSVFLREPNIKEGTGGLRDIHTAFWISRMKYGVTTFGGLVEKGIIPEKDSRRLKGSKDYLLRLRNEVHYLSGHRQDVLTFDMQEKAALDFGYTPNRGRMAVENFMRAYYIRARGVRDVTHGLIENALERPRNRWWFNFPTSTKRLEGGFYIMGRALCMDDTGREKLPESPEALLAAFAYSQEHGVPMSDVLKRSVTENVRSIKRSREAGGVFLEMLGRVERIYETLDLMHRMKALGRVLPEFGAVSALVQHDLYHMYTVDEHSLLAVKKIESLMGGEGMAYPDLRDTLLKVKDRPVLFLALLLHDCGKALGHGHAEQGARLAVEAALRLGMDSRRAEDVEFLVRNHLLMAHISQRRELSDRGVIEKFCRIVDRPELLGMLYLVTYADVSSVGPEVFNDWRRALLRELYERAGAFLKDEVSVIAYEKERLASLTDAIAKTVADKGLGKPSEARKFLANLPPRYILSVPVDRAARHFELTRGIKGTDVVVDFEHDEKGYTNLTVILHDMLGLFYMAAGALAAKNMNIISAQIFTGRDGIVVDTLQVTDYNKKPAVNEGLWGEVKDSLVKVLTGQARVEDMMPARPAYPKRTSLSDAPAKVVVDNEASDRYTVVEVFASDRVGLLYDITRALYQSGCYISSAKVDTEVDQVVDVFYVTDIFRQKLEDPDKIAALKDALVSSVSGGGK